MNYLAKFCVQNMAQIERYSLVLQFRLIVMFQRKRRRKSCNNNRHISHLITSYPYFRFSSDFFFEINLEMGFWTLLKWIEPRNSCVLTARCLTLYRIPLIHWTMLTMFIIDSHCVGKCLSWIFFDSSFFCVFFFVLCGSFSFLKLIKNLVSG